ncbi:MAG TPA: Crp/Fnr family transcriptional regulator [Gammaproteobacteria bacterium]|nr:Crp/Fnr family transcriptional regulator [Gammaproteobacteria bacterium]
MENIISSYPNHYPLIRKLESIAELSDDQRQAVLSLPLTIRKFDADQDIVRDGDRPSECCLIIEGFACRYKLNGEGRRQIMSFHIRGDIPDLQSLHLKVMDHSLSTLMPSTLGFVPHGSIRDIIKQCSILGDLFWRDTLIDAAVFREWMMGIGRRSAYVRIAHVLCELIVRMKAVGLVSDQACALPVTQAELGDALGLSTVHVNRTLQELRSDGLITLRGSRLEILNWEALKKAGEFDLTYLHLDEEHESAIA